MPRDDAGYDPGYEPGYEPGFINSSGSPIEHIGGAGAALGGPLPSQLGAPMSSLAIAAEPGSHVRAYAVDCEFIQVRQGKGPDARAFNVTVSVGIVSEMLETILYARVKQPPRCQVWDDSFARTVGNLEPDWSIGIRVDIACALVREFIDDGHVLVGWQIEGDLRGLKLEELLDSAGPDQIVDLSEHFKTTQGNKCQLSEAYREIFGRQGAAHDACGDARMTMELYNWWCAHNMQAAPLHLRWHYVKWHSITADNYETFRWSVLRPERSDRSTCIEEVDDAVAREFVLKFRSEGERVAYWNLVKRRLCSMFRVEAPPTRQLERGVRSDWPGCVGEMYDEFR